MIRRYFLLITGKSVKFITQLFIIIFFSRYLSLFDYGQYQSIWLYINILSVIALFGLPALLLSDNHHIVLTWIKNNRRPFLAAIFFTSLLPAIAFLFFAPLYGTTIKLWMVLLILVQNISIIAETIALKKENDRKVFASNIFYSFGFLISHLLIFYFDYSLVSILVSVNFLFIIKSMIVLLPLNFKTSESEREVIKPLGRQWLFLGLNDMIGVVATWLDKWIILLMLSFAQFAIYFNGAYEIPVFGLMLSSVGNIMLVEFSKRTGDDIAKAKSLFEESSLFLSSIMFPAFAFLLFYHNDFFLMIFGQKYAASIPIFFVTIFLIPVRITYSTIVLQTYHRSDLIVKGSLYDLIIAIILMAILYPALGMIGLALAFVLSSYFQFGFYLWHTSKLLKKPVYYFFPFKKLGIILLLSVAIMFVATFAISFLPKPFGLFAAAIVAILLMLAFTYNRYKKHNDIAA